ncbi:MAG: DUF354 domain-containing protein [Bacteroidales bacterium]|nr:MAG: DUF354 domain-containing protein [Bacteroidales bacterium]
MNILFDIGHPAHVHLYRNTIGKLKENGYKVVVTVKEIPSAIELLKIYNIPYLSLGKKFDHILLKGLSQLKYNYNLLRIVRKEKIQIAVGSSITITHVSRFTRMFSIVLDDDDANAVVLFSCLAHPFAHTILSPEALKHDRKRNKDITYKGTHELFYLHPNYFTPNPFVLNELGIKQDDTFFVLRFVAVKAYHDIGAHGLKTEQKLKIVEALKPFGRVLITTEREIEPELEEYALKISPEKIHHLLYYATLYVGDSQTMTSEAAILGTPALKCNTFAHKLSVPNMLEDPYDLCYSYQPEEFDLLIQKVNTLLLIPGLKKWWENKRNKFLKDSINPTEFLIWFIENFPSSIKTMKENPDFK